ncbi:uncharacterized protein Tco025E_05474 [Trypanosoma conorhini]|uniref:Uncharacterized protein n=1 Tax=Trypanosoma conorhini TaxID=83891 RepID=A0A422PD41_9TRYP|nr:uncharacterized protein Tco025E_05474 [Trypanosoma conorhini]RNF15610.1 hypothetical protein Tco025E_05474 [Trypanosoma conorhini]
MNVVFSLARVDLSSGAIALLALVVLLCVLRCLQQAGARWTHRDVRQPAMNSVGGTHDAPRVRQLMGKYASTVRVRACDAMLRRLPPEICLRLRLYLPLALGVVSWNSRQVVTMVYRELDVVRIWNARYHTERTAAARIGNWKRTSLPGDAVVGRATGKRGGHASTPTVVVICLD